VLDGIVGGAVLPQTPDHPAPGTPEDADRMLMGAAARAREGPERLGGIAVGLEQPLAGASTHASKLSRLPPAALKRGRIAATWLGCTAITRRPASSRRSTSSPCGRSSATSSTARPTSRAQRVDPALGVSVATTLDDPPIGIVDAHRVLLAGPVNSRKHRTPFDRPGLHAGEEVPWRALIGGALRARLPVAAQGTSTDRRRRWSHAGPWRGKRRWRSADGRRHPGGCPMSGGLQRRKPLKPLLWSRDSQVSKRPCRRHRRPVSSCL